MLKVVFQSMSINTLNDWDNEKIDDENGKRRMD